MTQEEIETIINENYHSIVDDGVDEKEAAKLILASHLRDKLQSQSDLLTELLYDESSADIVDLMYKKRHEIESELTKLNQ